jgi:hypothetical protein
VGDEETQVELRMCTPVHDRRSQVGGCVCGDDGGDEWEGERGGAGDGEGAAHALRMRVVLRDGVVS